MPAIFFVYIDKIRANFWQVAAMSKSGQIRDNKARNGTKGCPGKTVMFFWDTSLKIGTVSKSGKAGQICVGSDYQSANLKSLDKIPQDFKCANADDIGVRICHKIQQYQQYSLSGVAWRSGSVVGLDQRS